MSDQPQPFDYHIGQRYHGLGSPFFRAGLTRVPLSDQWLDDCQECGHQLFVQRSALHPGVPLLCVQCALELEFGKGVNASKFLNVEACPRGCFYVRRGSSQPV
jgi:hypothetical protein